MTLTMIIKHHHNGPWYAEVVEIPNVNAHGRDRDEVIGRTKELAAQAVDADADAEAIDWIISGDR